MTKGPEMTTDNPDPLEVWNKAVDAYDERLFGIPSPVTRADRTAAHQAAAAIIAQHYAPVIAENERLRETLEDIIEVTKYVPNTYARDANKLARQALGAKP